MIDWQSAVDFAARNYPNGPEALAAHLKIVVKSTSLPGCDGYCLNYGKSAIIRINSDLTQTRRRCTLAHELGHLILKTPSIIGETFNDMMRSDTATERDVNALASELLLPLKVLHSHFPNPPVVSTAIRRLAKEAKVSEIAVAIRVCNATEDLQLVNSVVAFFENDDLKWQWSKGLKMTGDTPVKLLKATRAVAPNVYRFEHEDTIGVASLLENPTLGSATLFVQLLPKGIGNRKSKAERRLELEAILLANDDELRNRLSGYFGAFKPQIKGMHIENAVTKFWNRYNSKLSGTTLISEEGREYVHLRITDLLR